MLRLSMLIKKGLEVHEKDVTDGNGAVGVEAGSIDVRTRRSAKRGGGGSTYQDISTQSLIARLQNLYIYSERHN